MSPYAAGYKQCDADSCIVLASDLPDVPERMMVYKLANHMTLENATAIARALKMNGTVSESDWGYHLHEGQRDLSIDTYDGSIRYSDESEWTSPDPLSVPDAVPSENEAIELAHDLLISNGMLHEEYIAWKPMTQTRGVSVNGIDAKGDTISLMYEGWSVRFGPTMDGYPTEEWARFDIGGTGDILALEGDWRDYRPYKEFPVVSPEEIYNRVVDHPLPDTGGNSTSGLSIEVFYLTSNESAMSGPYTEKTYLRPFYRIIRRTLVDGRPLGMIDPEYIPAIPELGEYYIRDTN